MELLADALAATWTVLSRVLGATQPSPETVDIVRDPAMLAQWPLCDPSLGSVGQLAEQGVEILRECHDSYRDITDDHFRLIRGPGEPIAVPWESVYRNEKRLVFDEATMDVRRWYQRYGLRAPRLNIEPDDHISLELEFLSRLLVMGLNTEDENAAQNLYNAHDEFCRQHLLVWASQFFLVVMKRADTNFYRGVGMLGQDALERVRAMLEER